MGSIYEAIGDTGTFERAAAPFGPARPRGGRGTRDAGVNVGRNERLVSVLAGGVLLGWSLRNRALRGLLVPLGGSLLARGLSGRCPVNRALGRNTAFGDAVSPVASVHRGEGIKVEKSVTINRPVAELYAFWRNFENLPRFMRHLESVTVLDGRRSRWRAHAPAGRTIEWEAEIHNEIPDELIAWRSLPGSEVNNAGSVHFRPAPAGRGTEVRVVLSYEPPAGSGRLGASIARLFGEEPSQQVEDALQRFKQVMEAGEIPSTQGQPAGAS